MLLILFLLFCWGQDTRTTFAPTRGEKDEAQVRTKVRITLLVTEDTFARLNRNTTSGDIVIDQKDGPTYFLPIEKVEYIREKR